jgi:methylated-DNA-[protein]-cysteine S-methyltransferase
VQLPEATATATRRRLRSRFEGSTESATPLAIEQAIDAMIALLEGRPADLTQAELDLDAVAEFDRRVYAITRAIPPGKTSSYGAIAATLGDPGAARAVGQALGRNPIPVIVPCHRVLSADGGVGGFSAAGGAVTKLRILAIEGAEVARQRPLFE